MRPAIALIESELGADHPLVHVLALREVIVRHLGLVSALAVALTPGVALGWIAAPWLLAAALATAAALAVAAVVLRLRRRELAVALIANGHDQGPAVSDERDRLMQLGRRRMLSRSLERIVAAVVDHPKWMRASTIPCCPGAIRAALPQLAEVRELLVAARPGVRGVALVHRLLVSADSPLRGSDSQRLCEELRRIVVLLQEPHAGAP